MSQSPTSLSKNNECEKRLFLEKIKNKKQKTKAEYIEKVKGMAHHTFHHLSLFTPNGIFFNYSKFLNKYH